MPLPLTLMPYNLDATSTVQVTIVYNYYTAQVAFYNGPVLVYSLTLIQSAPVASLPANLQLGNLVIISGTVMMQIPSSIQSGTVTLNCSFTDPNMPNPQFLNAVVATWNLNQ